MNKIKTIVFAVVGILLISSLALAIETVAARPSIADSIANRLTQASWVRINGVIDQWGTTDVRGQLQVQTRSALHDLSDAKEFTSATAIC